MGDAGNGESCLGGAYIVPCVRDVVCRMLLRNLLQIIIKMVLM